MSIKKNLLLYLFFSMFSLIAIAQKNNSTVSLKGQLKNFSNQVEVEDMSDLQYLLPPTSERMIIPDTSGHFNISFKVESPNYFRLGRNILYLSPGDNMEVFIDKNSPLKATFEGKGSEANLYLRNTPFPKAGSFMEAGRNAKLVPQETIDILVKMGDDRKKELDEVKGVSSEFKRLEYARIKADLLNSLLAGQSSYRPRMSKDSLANYTAVYTPLIQPLVDKYSKDFIDASLMKLVVYRDVADGLIKKPGNEKEITQIKDWFLATKLNDEMKRISDKQELSKYSAKTDSISTKKYHDALQKSLAVLLKFGKGDMASDFTAVDMNGRKVSLSSLKGKVIYVDLWATWCGPCLAEMPHYDSLKIKYKDNNQVAFVSLSIDDGTDLWIKNVEKRNADGIQWLINRTKLDAYNIVGIPRTLLIDKNFKIVDMNGPVPSSKELPAILDNLIKM
jgi:thiol-disulfide isomerase/thioredoxin